MNQLEPQHITIKLQTLDGVLHTKHGLLHDVIFGFGGTLVRHEGRDVRLRHGAVGHFESGWVVGGFGEGVISECCDEGWAAVDLEECEGRGCDDLHCWRESALAGGWAMVLQVSSLGAIGISSPLIFIQIQIDFALQYTKVPPKIPITKQVGGK